MQAEAALRQAEIVRWLASNPAQRTDAPGRDPSVLLHRLQLGQASAPPSAGRQVPHPCPSHTRVCCCSHGHCSCVPGGRGAPGTMPQAGLLCMTHEWHHSWADRKYATCMLGGPDTCGAGESVVVSAVVLRGSAMQVMWCMLALGMSLLQLGLPNTQPQVLTHVVQE